VALEELDKILLATAKLHMVVLGKVNIARADRWDSPELGRLGQHPDYDPHDVNSMANVTSFAGVQLYAAILDLLAQRYCQPGNPHCRIHHWILHNEINAGWEWTNCGDKPELVYLDQYYKSMRIVYNTVRKYDSHAQVFISLAHSWTLTPVNPENFTSRSLLDNLLLFCRKEGDFEWGIGFHPYPESLMEPKSWLDQKCDFTFNTPLITFKNIEVLDAWVKQPRVLYRGQTIRPVYLSEQGSNSRDYSPKALAKQAASLAYVWKKIAPLDSILGFEYHNWMDVPWEGGLRLGLRKFADDPDDPLGRKPIWFVYQALGTPKEEAAIAFAKPIIGITDWKQVLHPVTNSAK